MQSKGDFRQGSKVQGPMIQAILLVESFKLVPKPLDEGPGPKSGKLRLPYMTPILEGKSIGSNQKQCYKESSWFGELKIKLGTKV
jgi:hypothetical protein